MFFAPVGTCRLRDNPMARNVGFENAAVGSPPVPSADARVQAKPFLPFAKPLIGQNEIDEVIDTLRSGWLTTGKKTAQFETDFAQYIGTRNALAVNSATSGLHLAVDALGLAPGDLVATTTFTFTATAEILRYAGAHPVFVDIDPRTFNIDVAKLEVTLSRTPGIKGILPVHFGGQSCDMDAIVRLARKYGCWVVDDAAHALPATHNGRLVGTLADATVFSFYANKTITTGEGGMVVTNRDDLAKHMRTMRLHGIDRDAFSRYTVGGASWYYEVVAPGFKYNMMDICAAIGIHQLKQADDFQLRREAIARMYDEGLGQLPVTTPFIAAPNDRHAYHLYVIQTDPEHLSRDALVKRLLEQGIGTSVHFIPLHLQPYWRDTYKLARGDFPMANAVYERCVSLPIYPAMSDSDVERVIEAVRRAVRT